MEYLRRLVAAATLGVGYMWFAVSFDYIDNPSKASTLIGASFLVLGGIHIILEWRSRKERTLNEPSPAQSARNVILFTGLAGVIATAQDANSLADYAVPMLIAIIAMALAFIAFRFASKNEDQIGEARFDTTANGD